MMHIKILILVWPAKLKRLSMQSSPSPLHPQLENTKRTELYKTSSVLFLFIIFLFKHIEHWFLKTIFYRFRSLLITYSWNHTFK